MDIESAHVPLSPTSSSKSLSGWEKNLAGWESGLCAFLKSFQDTASVRSPSHNRLEGWRGHQLPSALNKRFPYQTGRLGKEGRAEGITEQTVMVEVISNCAGTHTHHPALDVKRQQTKLKQRREDRGCFPSWVHFFLFTVFNKISVYGVGFF